MIKAAFKPRWDSCRVSGVDVDQLKTVVKFRLSRSGGLAGFTSVTTTGENASNKFQAQRHQECAKRAVELAAPLDLPDDEYDFWQNYTDRKSVVKGKRVAVSVDTGGRRSI